MRVPEIAPVRTRGVFATHQGARRTHDDQAAVFIADATTAFASVARGWFMRGWSHPGPGKPAAELILDAGVRIFRELTKSMLDDLAELWWTAEHEGSRVRPFSSLPIADRAELRARVKRLLADRVADALGDQAVLEGETKRLLEMPALALARAGNDLERRMERDRTGWTGAGGTAMSAIFAAGQISIAHLGDCRAFRLRRVALDVLTKEHTMEREYEEGGREGDAPTERTRGGIVRTVNYPTKGPDRVVAPVEKGDYYVLATKGFVDAFDANAIKRALEEHGVEAARSLVSAGAKSAPENIAAVAVEIL